MDLSEIEKLVTKVKELLYRSKPFTYALVGLIILIAIAFPRFTLLIVATSVIFALIKVMIMVIDMINKK